MRRSSICAFVIVVLMLMTSSCALSPAGSTPPGGNTLTISPSTANVRAGSVQQFRPSSTAQPLTWLVNGVAGGSAASGLIDANGNYTAPATLPSPNSVTIEAEESSKTSVNGSSAVTLWNPIPQISNISPASLSVGNFTLTITGSDFVSGATVSFGGANLTTTFISSTQLTASGTALASQVGAVAVHVANPNPGASPSNTLNAQVAGGTLTISPLSANIRAGSTQQFIPSITTNPLTWLVNGIAGGNATVGTIDANGNYTAPATLPSPNSVTIEAEQTSKTSINGSSAVTLWNPLAQISSVSPSQINVGPFTLTVTGTDFVSGAIVSFGGANLTTTFVSSTQLTATGTASVAQVGEIAVDVANPNPGASPSNSLNAQVIGTITIPSAAAARLLEQTTFGPTPALINQAQIQGVQNFLNAQYTAPLTPYPDPLAGETNLGPLQQRYWVINLTAQDQLRQRVALALSYIWVIGGDKIGDPNGYTNWLRLLDKDAFTNYRQIMYDVTVSPAMGHWLDMVNNGKPNVAAGDHANENYARELMQLFTIGTGQLNPDGSLQLDSNNLPIPTYSQDQVEAFARAYTGWTYPLTPGTTQQKYNPPYWIGPMVAVDSNHDVGTKQLLTYPGAAGGGLLPAGQSSVQDLNGALDNIFNHPNVGPFVCAQLIQHLVTSNPSPAYVQRVAAVFANNGAGVRGDMKSVITAILMDSEARRGDDPAAAVGTDGHLQDPILLLSGVMRAFGATTDGSSLSGYASSMGQNPLFSPSVFNFYSPSYVVPGTTSLGPEFQILTTATSLNRANWINTFAFGSFGGESVSFSSWAAQASNPGAMVDALNALLLHGSMSADMKTAIVTAVQAVPAGSTQATRQAQTAIYLVTSSSQYQVRH